MLDARAMRFETLRYGWDPDNPLSGEHPSIRDLSGHAQIASPLVDETTGRSKVADDLASTKDPSHAARN